jgi:prephenate dehydrogenase
MKSRMHTIPPCRPQPDERPAIRSQTFNSMAVIGLGAIGGSLAWGSRRRGMARVVGYSPDADEAIAAERAGAVTELAATPDAGLDGVDLVALAAPPRATLELIPRLAARLTGGAILTDVASIKASILDAARAAGLERRFVGAHPLAGTHDSGFAAASPDLLRGCVVYICAAGEGGRDAASRVAEFWTDTFDASPVFIDAGAHDRQLAWTSHLPQAVAYALAATLAGRGVPSDTLGPGARDTMRLAASAPTLWIDIFLENREPILAALSAAGERLEALRHLIETRDEAGLRAFLSSAARFRRGAGR